MQRERNSQILAFEFQNELLVCIAMMAVWKQSDYIYQEPESYLVKDRIGQFWDQRRLLLLWDGEEVEWEWKEMEEADVPGLNPGEENRMG